jgi:DNA-binding XRE family transcriptional regulator
VSNFVVGQTKNDTSPCRACHAGVQRFPLVLTISNGARHKGRMISPAQCRAARGLLDWTQGELAEKAGVGVVTVRQFEGGKTQPLYATLVVLKSTFEDAGIEFLNGTGPGVRMRPQS